jgi:outer membrane receptor protein involved in Fe transport
VPGPGLLSPRASISFAVEPGTRIRASAWQRMTAPGAEEFLPPTQSNLWLPPERTFAPMVSGDLFQAERARHLEIALEHGHEWVIGVRRFQQNVDNQIVNVFGVREIPGPRTDLGHYYVANAGQVETSGWGVSLARPMASRFRGSVSYTVTNASWTPTADAALLSVIAPTATRRLGSERFHDVTTSLESDFPETDTRIFVIYKVNTAFSKPSVENPRPGADVRFDVQINQALPFLRFTNTQWEVLVAVRNLFHEQVDGSVYDELMVIRPPKRIVGGLTVRF